MQVKFQGQVDVIISLQSLINAQTVKQQIDFRFDEIVIILFIGGPQQHTLPLQMWSGIRQEISPTILSAATILVLFSVVLLTTLEMLRRRSERLRGITPH